MPISAEPPPPLLELAGVAGGYGGRSILGGVDLVVGGGEIVCIIGHNGAGKSTVLKAICNMLPERSGSIRFDGRDIGGVPAHLMLAIGLAVVPQHHSIFPRLTVAENLVLGGYLLRDKALLRRRVEATEALFPRLVERRGQFAGNLSGGEQRMLELARTLVMDPKLILLDEPSIGLAPRMIDLVFETVERLRRLGKSFLMVEQNVRKGLSASDRAYVLDLGRIRLEGAARAMIDDPRLARLYMGG
jgi:branched-chain amino acid transport system ATP-binding protein